LKVLLSVRYILRYIYPGDYASFLDGYYDIDDQYCDPCHLGHLIGKPNEQWQDPMLANKKREDNNIEGLYSAIANEGITTPIAIDTSPHRVVSNGHHRFYAALDLGWKYIPAEFLDPDRQVKILNCGVNPRFMRPWYGTPHTESNHLKALAS
jgi:hypothetical protein